MSKANYQLLESLDFLTELSRNNNREWFEANRKRYENCRAGFTTFVEHWLAGLKEKDISLAELNAKSALFRINRDVRFSANKAPYKLNFSAYLAKGGKKFPGAGYYFHLEPGASFFASGVWMPEAPLLQAIRQEIDYNYLDFEKILGNTKFKKHFHELEGERLTRPPKGYSLENPAIERIKHKSFIVSTKLNPELQSAEELLNYLLDVSTAAIPLVYFLNQALAESD